MLLANGAEINAQNDDLDTAMHLAIATQQIDIIYLLLRKGSNVFIKGLNEKDCVEIAIESGYKDLAKYMKNYGLCMKQHLSCGQFNKLS